MNRTFVCPKPEEITLNTPYCFTISPKDQPELNLNDPILGVANSRLDSAVRSMRAHLMRLGGCYIKVNTELSSTGRIHYHGWITITDIKLFYLHDYEVLQKYGTYKINKETELMDADKAKYKTWNSYIIKQSTIWGDDYMNIIVPKKMAPVKVQRMPHMLAKITDIIE